MRRPYKKLGLRIPVYQMRRFFNAYGKSLRNKGVTIHQILGKPVPENWVSVQFDSAAEADRFYKAMIDMRDQFASDQP